MENIISPNFFQSQYMRPTMYAPAAPIILIIILIWFVKKIIDSTTIDKFIINKYDDI